MGTPLRELLIIRHAKSDWSDDSLEDFDRPLSDKGKKQACKMGHWLAEHDLIPDLILASPAQRAQQTLSRMTRHWDTKPDIIEEPRLYEADLDTLLDIVRHLPDRHRIAIVGHNPGLEDLLGWLTGNNEDGRLSTCAIAHLILPGDLSQLNAGEAKLTQKITPKSA